MPKKGKQKPDDLYKELAQKYKAQDLEDWDDRAWKEAYGPKKDTSFEDKKGSVKPPRPRHKTDTIDFRIPNTYIPWRRLQLKLQELEDEYGIVSGEIILRLFSPGNISGVGLPIVVHQLRDLPLIQARACLYQRVLNLHEEHLRHYQQARGKVSELIEGVENLREAALLEETSLLLSLIEKVCRRGKYLLDLAERTKLSRGKRRNNPQQWELIGDVAVDLYEYLAKKIPSDRKIKLGKVGRTDPRPYTQSALTATAELMTFAYSPYIKGFELTPGDIRSRLQQRRLPTVR